MSGALAFLFAGAATGAGGGGVGPGGLTATIGDGEGGSGGASHLFSVNTCVAAGGTGPYSYAWSETDDSAGTWTAGGATAALAPRVTSVVAGDFTVAQYVCTVTDSLGHTAISNIASYAWHNNRGGIPP
jgi:hypothetical protein